MNIWNILQLIAIAGCAVCAGLAISVAVAFEIKARKLRREIEAELEENKRKNG